MVRRETLPVGETGFGLVLEPDVLLNEVSRLAVAQRGVDRLERVEPEKLLGGPADG